MGRPTALTLTQIGRLRGEGRTQAWKRWRRGEYGSIKKKPGQVVRVPVSAIERATGLSYSPEEIAAAIVPRKDDLRAIESRAVLDRARELPDKIKDAVVAICDGAWRKWERSAIEQTALPDGPLTGLDDIAPELRLIIEARSAQWRPIIEQHKTRQASRFQAEPSRYLLGI
jgi:hypothetical protein